MRVNEALQRGAVVRASAASVAAPAVSLRELRRANGWTQQHLAQKARVSPRTIHSIENGKAPARVYIRRKLLTALQCHWQIQEDVFGPLGWRERR